MNDRYILMGAGTIGRLIARQLIAKGTPPVAFADNDIIGKSGTKIEGISVMSPEDALIMYPDAKWVATVHRIPARPEILKQLEEMRVGQISLYEFLPARCDLPPDDADETVRSLMADEESVSEWNDQLEFRRNSTTYPQRAPHDISSVYFEDFFSHRNDEHFVDCGAADGDTVRDFMARWSEFKQITAFEPDPENMRKLLDSTWGNSKVIRIAGAVSDFCGVAFFADTHDQTAHLATDGIKMNCYKLDDTVKVIPPTFIKMDIEGSELEGLRGAQEIIKKHSPVLAICAYHLGSHLWEIPLLIHAMNPTYKLYLRRYLEATWELIWYAVPPERVI